ncbi:hypothetical protein LAZ67_9002132 [Cordylochernes scorpioides]|uniref:Cyclic nucleotide-binding domain-containing protein n=1 Tax=Cordylochernes scorpioides TaxID=51811 RepID=A0ABY6KV86_9ARAC|nr:hypothetical protein LAZ67_9002132 [Cordylochernes scorpioides]
MSLCFCKEADPQMSEEDKISHLMKGIAEELYQALLPRDVQSTEQFITECRRVEALRCRRVTPTKYERLPNVASLCDQDDGEDLSSLIRKIYYVVIETDDTKLTFLQKGQLTPKSAIFGYGKWKNIAEARAQQAMGTIDQCVYVEHWPEFSQLQYVWALDKLVGGINIIQLTKMNGHVLVGLAIKAPAERLIEEGLEIEESLLKTFPFCRRAKTVVVSNLALRRGGCGGHCRHEASRASRIYRPAARQRCGIPNEGWTPGTVHPSERGREAEKAPNAPQHQPQRGYSTGPFAYGVKCSRCQRQGHRRANCLLTPKRPADAFDLSSPEGREDQRDSINLTPPGKLTKTKSDLNSLLEQVPGSLFSEIEKLRLEREPVIEDLFSILDLKNLLTSSYTPRKSLDYSQDFYFGYSAIFARLTASRGSGLACLFVLGVALLRHRVLWPGLIDVVHLDVLSQKMTVINCHLSHAPHERLEQLRIIAETAVRENACVVGDLNIDGDPAGTTDSASVETLYNLLSAAALEDLSSYIEDVRWAAEDHDDGELWSGWNRKKAGIFTEIKSLYTPGPESDDEYVTRANRYIRARLEASSTEADYPSLPDLGRALRRHAATSVRDDEGEIKVDSAEVENFIAGNTTPIILEEDDPLHQSDISREEIAAAIRTRPTGKAPEWDSLPCQLFFAYAYFFSALRWRVFGVSLVRGVLPSYTSRGFICLVPKALSILRPTVFRPITLPSTDYRVPVAILLRRLRSHLPTLAIDCQTYAIPGRSPSWNNSRVTDEVEIATAGCLLLAVVSVDLESAFDSLDRGFLLSLLVSLDLPPVFIRWIQVLYAGANAAVQIREHHIAAFPLLNGVRQGNVFAYAEDIVLMIREGEHFGEVASIFQGFQRASGNRVYFRKSVGLWYGAWRARVDSPLEISWTNTCLKMLGCDLRPKASAAMQEEHRLDLLDAAYRRWATFTCGLSLVGRTRADKCLVLSSFMHHFHGYIPTDSFISKLQARLVRFVWVPDRTAWLPACVISRPVSLGSFGLLDLGTHMRLACLKWVRTALRGGAGTWISTRRRRLVGVWEADSEIQTFNYKVLQRNQLLDLTIIEGCQFLRPPDLLAASQWVGARFGAAMGPLLHILLVQWCRRGYRASRNGYALPASDHPHLPPHATAPTPDCSTYLPSPEPMTAPTVRLALQALPHPAYPALARVSCIACGSGDLSLAHRYWSCRRIRPVILEAITIIQKPLTCRAGSSGMACLEPWKAFAELLNRTSLVDTVTIFDAAHLPTRVASYGSRVDAARLDRVSNTFKTLRTGHPLLDIQIPCSDHTVAILLQRAEELLGEASLKIEDIPSGDLWRERGNLKRELVEDIKCLSIPRAEDENYIVRASRFLRSRLETVDADYPSLPELGRALCVQLHRSEMVTVFNAQGNPVEGESLRHIVLNSLRERFDSSACSPEAITCSSRAFEDSFGGAIHRVILESKLRGALPESSRRNIICLVPKDTVVRALSGYRPISLPTEDYRIVSGIFWVVFEATYQPWCRNVRHTPFRGDVPPGISRVSEEVILASAFDNVDREFLAAQLRSIGPPPPFLKWLHLLYAEADATIKVNGNFTLHSKCAKGFGRVVPAAQPFSPSSTGPPLSHLERALGRGNVLADADDILLLIREDWQFENIKTIFDEFRHASGICVNFTTMHHHLHGYLPCDVTIAKLQARLTRFVWGSCYRASWLPGTVMARPVSVGGVGLLDIKTQLQIACFKGVQTANRVGGRNAYSWLVESVVWMAPMSSGGLAAGTSSPSTGVVGAGLLHSWALNHRRGSWRPPSLRAPSRWSGVRIRDLAGPAPSLTTRVTRKHLRRCQPPLFLSAGRLALVLRGTATPFLVHQHTHCASHIGASPLAAVPISRYLWRWAPVVDVPSTSLALHLSVAAPSGAMQRTSLCGWPCKPCLMRGTRRQASLSASPAAPVIYNWPTATGSVAPSAPLIREAFSIIGRPPDRQSWIFAAGLEDHAITLSSGAKHAIYIFSSIAKLVVSLETRWRSSIKFCRGGRGAMYTFIHPSLARGDHPKTAWHRQAIDEMGRSRRSEDQLPMEEENKGFTKAAAAKPILSQRPVPKSKAQYFLALEAKLGKGSVYQLTKMERHILVGLFSVQFADKLIEEGLEIEDATLRAFNLRKRAERIVLGNVLFFVEDGDLVAALRPYGQLTSILQKMVPSKDSCWADARREIFITLRDGVELSQIPRPAGCQANHEMDDLLKNEKVSVIIASVQEPGLERKYLLQALTHNGKWTGSLPFEKKKAIDNLATAFTRKKLCSTDRMNFRVATLNTRGIAALRRRIQLCCFLKKHEIDIFFLQETNVISPEEVGDLCHGYNAVVGSGLACVFVVVVHRQQILWPGKIAVIDLTVRGVSMTCVNAHVSHAPEEAAASSRSSQPWRVKKVRESSVT